MDLTPFLHFFDSTKRLLLLFFFFFFFLCFLDVLGKEYYVAKLCPNMIHFGVLDLVSF